MSDGRFTNSASFLNQMIGSRQLRSNVNEAFEMLEDGIVIVTSHGKPKAIMVSPEDWAGLMERLNTLEEGKTIT